MIQRLKLLAFLTFVSVTFLIAAYSASKQVIDEIVEQLVWKYAQVSAHHDAEMLLAPIIKEVDLVKKLSSHPNITSWGMNSHDDVYRAVAEDTLDRYRWQLKSKNFFIVLDENLAYHYNDVQSVRQQSFLRYYLDPTSNQDKWYFDQRERKVDLSVNIAKDAHLGLTRVWINQSIVKDGRFLGIVGTGIDTDLLFERFDDHHSHALKTLFVDEARRIQFSVDAHNYHYPLRDSNNTNTKPTLRDFIPDKQEYLTIEALMQQQKVGEEAQVLVVQQEGRKAVVAIQYIEAIGWYELTFVSVDAMVPTWVSATQYLPLIAGLLLCVLLSYRYLLKRWIVPSERLNQRLSGLMQHKVKHQDAREMLDSIERELTLARTRLEELVVSRTKQIDELSVVDVVTGLHNRRGLEIALSEELARASREQYQFGLIWIDVGLSGDGGGQFDVAEHQQALETVAASLTKAIREYDAAARWANDEFLLLIRSDCQDTLSQIACRIKHYLERQNADGQSMTELTENLSIGGTLIKHNLSMQQALALADSSLYIAKSDAKNAIYIHDISNVA